MQLKRKKSLLIKVLFHARLSANEKSWDFSLHSLCHKILMKILKIQSVWKRIIFLTLITVIAMYCIFIIICCNILMRYQIEKWISSSLPKKGIFVKQLLLFCFFFIFYYHLQKITKLFANIKVVCGDNISRKILCKWKKNGVISV